MGSPYGVTGEAGERVTVTALRTYRSYSNEVRPGIPSSTCPLSSHTLFIGSWISSYSQRSAFRPSPRGENHKTGHFSASLQRNSADSSIPRCRIVSLTYPILWLRAMHINPDPHLPPFTFDFVVSGRTQVSEPYANLLNRIFTLRGKGSALAVGEGWLKRFRLNVSLVRRNYTDVWLFFLSPD